MNKNTTCQHIKDALTAISIGSYIHQSNIAKKHGLSATDLLAIYVIGKFGEISPSELAAQLHLTSGATTAAADRLAKLGYIRRKHSTTDRRQIKIMLTKNNDLLSEYGEISGKIEKLLQGMDPNESKIILRFLNALAYS